MAGSASAAAGTKLLPRVWRYLCDGAAFAMYASATLAYINALQIRTVDTVWLRGWSMRPTFCDDYITDCVLMDRLTVPDSVGVGDVVVSKHPRHPTRRICKRVVGLEGDCITWCERVPGPASADPPLDYEECPSHLRRETVVGPGSVFLAGDNPEWSVDSRTFGCSPVNLIEGKVIARIFPTLEKVRNDPSYTLRYRNRHLKTEDPLQGNQSTAVDGTTPELPQEIHPHITTQQG